MSDSSAYKCSCYSAYLYLRTIMPLLARHFNFQDGSQHFAHNPDIQLGNPVHDHVLDDLVDLLHEPATAATSPHRSRCANGRLALIARFCPTHHAVELHRVSFNSDHVNRELLLHDDLGLLLAVRALLGASAPHALRLSDFVQHSSLASNRLSWNSY